jgi:hypothetical protein
MDEPDWKSLPAPDVNSRWDRPHSGSTRTCRVMGVVEGYVVARHSGCSPFLIHMSDWHGIYRVKILPKRQRKGIEKLRLPQETVERSHD